MDVILYFIVFIHAILHYQKHITCISGLDVGKHQPGCNISQIHNGKHKNYRVDCNGKSLNYVPSCDMLPVNCGLVTELLLCHNQIIDLPPSVFTDFTNLKLLDISNNPVDRIQNGTFIGLYKLTGLRMVGLKPEGYVTVEKDAFRILTSLKWVNMKYSQINKHSLFYSLCSIIAELDELNISWLASLTYSQQIYLTGTLTYCFSQIQVKKLIMDAFGITGLTFDASQNMKHLQYFSVQKNEILMKGTTLSVALATFHNLSYLNGNCQKSETCEDTYPWSDWLPDQPVLSPHRDIKRYDHCESKSSTIYADVCFLSKLQTVKLSHTNGCIYIPPFCWKNNNLINLDYSFNTEIVFIPSVLPCFQHLEYLNLRGVRTLIFGEKAFHGMPSLKVLLLGSANIPQSTFQVKSTSLLQQTKQLTFLDISQLRITKLPKDVFNSLHKLNSLILSNNFLTDVTGLFQNLTALHHLDISNNKLLSIPVDTILMMMQGKGKKKYLRMTNNPFLCNCNSIDKLDITLHSNVIIEDLHSSNGTLKCTLPDKHVLSFDEAFSVLRVQCYKRNQVFQIVVYPFILSLIVISVCCYRFWLKVLYAWYIILNMLQQKKVQSNQKKIQYDAFVAYSQKDEEWVRTILIRKLENQAKPYFLCVHYRSFLPGQYIAQSIIDAVAKSRKTILVVTKGFVRSSWCEFESAAAQSHHLHQRINTCGIVAIVFPGAHRMSARKPALCKLLDEVTYLEWPRDAEELRLFWLRLESALGPPINEPNMKNNIILNT